MTDTADTITVILQGGLGNQMFQYAIGLSLALANGRRVLVDTSPVDTDPQRSYELHACRPPPDRISSPTLWLLRILRNTPVWSYAGRDRRRLYAGGPRLVRERSAVYDPSVSTLQGSLVLDGYWQSEEYFRVCRHSIEQTFDWTAAVQDDNHRNLAERMAATPSVSVHVRRGDYANDPRTRNCHGTCEPDYYERAARVILQHVEDPLFFVFSDDPAWAQSHIRLPGRIEFVWHRAPVPPHVDMWLMSRCRHAIIANSSYSWWAAWLAERPSACVVAPNQWYLDPAMRHVTPVPTRWHRV